MARTGIGFLTFKHGRNAPKAAVPGAGDAARVDTPLPRLRHDQIDRTPCPADRRPAGPLPDRPVRRAAAVRRLRHDRGLAAPGHRDPPERSDVRRSDGGNRRISRCRHAGPADAGRPRVGRRHRSRAGDADASAGSASACPRRRRPRPPPAGARDQGAAVGGAAVQRRACRCRPEALPRAANARRSGGRTGRPDPLGPAAAACRGTEGVDAAAAPALVGLAGRTGVAVVFGRLPGPELRRRTRIAARLSPGQTRLPDRISRSGRTASRM